MSKYIYINSFPAGSPLANNIVNLIPVDEIGDFETEFGDQPLRLQFTLLNFLSGGGGSQSYGVSINNGMSALEAKTILDQAVSKILIQANTSLEEVINFYPPSGISISSFN